jgi:site-specific recombinase XerD
MRAWARHAHWPSDTLSEYKAPTPGRYGAHDIPEGMDGIRRMLDYCKSDSQRALVALMGFHGLRVSEAIAVRPSHFDLEEMELTIRGKGDKTRFVPISSEAWTILASPYMHALEEDSTLVEIKDRAARSTIKMLGRKARLRREIASHDLRATFATATHDLTKDMRVTQELLGHSNINTTQGYVGTSRKKLRDAVESL